MDFINHRQWLSSDEHSKLDAPLSSDSEQLISNNAGAGWHFFSVEHSNHWLLFFNCL
ncbi:hypothetical protein [Yersinia mollaretii]|uniref:hypothetical protein n=1 Tax=Yersinia mollaretii TaxID=33060 RepID=UPI001643DBD2|nr:hypothetical protein [Yersinia mollaretii]